MIALLTQEPMRSALSQLMSAALPVPQLCRAQNVSASGSVGTENGILQEWLMPFVMPTDPLVATIAYVSVSRSAAKRADERLAQTIRRWHAESYQRYGSPRIHSEIANREAAVALSLWHDCCVNRPPGQMQMALARVYHRQQAHLVLGL